MYDVTITNNYIYAFFLDTGNQAFVPGQTYQFKGWGTMLINLEDLTVD